MSSDYKLYVVVEKDGKPRAARIARRDYLDDRRIMTAAAILSGEPVSMCVRVEVSGERVFADVLPTGPTKADKAVVERAVRHCRREVTGAEITARLRSRKPSRNDLFGAQA